MTASVDKIAMATTIGDGETGNTSETSGVCKTSDASDVDEIDDVDETTKLATWMKWGCRRNGQRG